MNATHDDTYVDVTKAFFDTVDCIEKGKVDVNPYFVMLEGARALEMGNSKLDTGLINLSQKEILFDSSAPRSLAEVVSIMNKLIVLYMTWVNGSALSVTVLSSRMMLDFLQNFTVCRSLTKANLISRLHGPDYEVGVDNNSVVVNVVLRAFIIGLAKCIGFSIKVARDVLYEEEDLITRGMDLDFLTQVSPQSVLEELDNAKRRLQNLPGLQQDGNFEVCVDFLKLIERMVCVEDVLTMEIHLFQANHEYKLERLEETLSLISALKGINFQQVPEGSFSRFAQLDCNNKHIPSENFEVPQEQAYDDLSKTFSTINYIIASFHKIENVSQLLTFLEYDIAHDIASEANALVRGIFQIFFIRDDRSIAGSEESITSIATRLMSTLSLCGNSIMDPSQWNQQNCPNNEATKLTYVNKIAQLLDDFESAIYQKLSVCGNNRCRQRQINNKNIILWDSLHFNAEAVENELFQNGIGDKLSAKFDNQPALGITSVIYYEKLQVMIDVALSGFEQDLYTHHEAHMIYWYVSELCFVSYEHIVGRIKEINSGKLGYISSLSKKIKKAKAGPKKETLKATYRQLVEHAEPTLVANVIFIEKFLSIEKLCVYYVCKGISMTLQILQAITLLKDTKAHNLTTEERLYKLRMKPWSSVGVPELPSFEQYKDQNCIGELLSCVTDGARASKIVEFTRTAISQLDKALVNCQALIHNMETEPTLRERLTVNGDCKARKWYSKLSQTCEIYLALLATIESTENASFKMTRSKGCLSYFPIYGISNRDNF